MKNKAFFFEIKDILTQFITAFDNCVISRYNKNREEEEQIVVRYVLAPKQRVMYDIVNKAQNLTLPVVSISVTNVERDPTRVFNKIEPINLPAVDRVTGPYTKSIPSPVPINIEVSMSILTKYMNDMDQIISNFVPYSNPYIILSWLTPQEFGLAYDTEIRSEVLWNGSIPITSPTELTYSDKIRCVGDTSFTIKTWLFKEVGEPVDIIYKVDANFHNASLNKNIIGYDSYESLSAINYMETETVTVSASPTITNLFYTVSGSTIRVQDPLSIQRGNTNSFIVYGTRFDYNNKFYLSCSNPMLCANFVEVSTVLSPTISAYDIGQYVSLLNDNVYSMYLPMNTLSAAGAFTLVTSNSAGWAKSSDGYVVSVD